MVLCLWESAALGTTAVPVKLCFLQCFYTELLIINSKKKSCSYQFYWKDSTQISYNMLVADGALEPLLGASKEQQNLHVWIHLSSPAKKMLCIPQFHFSISSGGRHKIFGSWPVPTKATPKGSAGTGYARGMQLWVTRGKVQKGLCREKTDRDMVAGCVCITLLKFT